MPEVKIIIFYNYTMKNIVGKHKTEQNVSWPGTCTEFIVCT